MLPMPDDISCHRGNALQNVDLSSRDAIDADGQVTNLQPHRLMEEPLHPLDKFVTTKSQKSYKDNLWGSITMQQLHRNR